MGKQNKIMSYFDLLKKYKGVINLATSEELQQAWKDAEENGMGMVEAVREARIAYRKSLMQPV